MKLFNSFYNKVINENLYLAPDNQEIKYVWDNNNADNNTPLGNTSNIPGNEQYQLVAKFEGSFRFVVGDQAEYVNAGKSDKCRSRVFIGYRTIHGPRIERGERKNKVMAAVKGTAQKKLTTGGNYDVKYYQKPTPQPSEPSREADEPARPPLPVSYKIYDYEKDFYAMPPGQYNDLINHAVLAFANHVNREPKYTYITFPQSRSVNVRDIADALIEGGVAVDNVQVDEISKLVISHKNPKYYTQEQGYKIFNVDRIVDLFSRYMPAATRANIKRGVNNWFRQYTDHPRWSVQGDMISTASHIRPIPMGKIAREVADTINTAIVPIALDNGNISNEPGGRLNDYASSHLDTDRFINAYQKIMANNPNRQQYRQSLQDIDARIQRLENSIKTEKDRNRIQNTLIPDLNDAKKQRSNIYAMGRECLDKILIVDDNINSGDIYKQVKSIIQHFGPNVRVDFFFLLCDETYAPNN